MNNMNKQQLFAFITEVSFALDDISLYLDTHPEDTEAIAYFEKQNQMYREALHEYSTQYGPLTLSHVHNPKDYWTWADQPWPWQ